MLDPDLNNVQVETWHKESSPQTSISPGLCFLNFNDFWWRNWCTNKYICFYLTDPDFKWVWLSINGVAYQLAPLLRAAVSEQKAKYIELPLDELEAKYDKDWLQERIVRCLALKN